MNDEYQTIEALSKLFEKQVEEAINSDLPKYSKGIVKGCEQIIIVARHLYKYYIPLRKLTSESVLTASKMQIKSGFCSSSRDAVVDKYMTWLVPHPLMKNMHVYYGVGTETDNLIRWHRGPFGLHSIVDTTRTRVYKKVCTVGKDYVELMWGAFAAADCKVITTNNEYFILTAHRS